MKNTKNTGVNLNKEIDEFIKEVNINMSIKNTLYSMLLNDLLDESIINELYYHYGDGTYNIEISILKSHDKNVGIEELEYYIKEYECICDSFDVLYNSLYINIVSFLNDIIQEYSNNYADFYEYIKNNIKIIAVYNDIREKIYTNIYT